MLRKFGNVARKKSQNVDKQRHEKKRRKLFGFRQNCGGRSTPDTCEGQNKMHMTSFPRNHEDFHFKKYKHEEEKRRTRVRTSRKI